MASYNANPRPEPIVIKNFLGLNEAVGETQIELGESVSMKNFRITKNFKAQKREGYATLIDYENEFPVYAWQGKLNGDEVIISSNNGKIYEYDILTETNTQIGTLTDTSFVNFFNFDGVLYIQNGTEYKSYNGSTYQDVDPYIPTIAIETPPAGGGTLFEELNRLTSKRKQEFRADGTSDKYYIATSNPTEVTNVSVLVNGASVSWSYNSSGYYFIDASLTEDEDLVEITWSEDNYDESDSIKNCKYAMDFGAGNDTNVFMWGNENTPNRRYRSYIQNPAYFPINNFTDIGSSEFAITDIVGQYSRQIIFKENATFFSKPEQISYADGVFEFEYPVFDLNENVGNVAFNQVRLIRNNPFSLFARSMWEWVATNVEDEKNAKIISDKIKLSLLELDLSQAITFDYQRLNEYWLCFDDEVYIMNYFNDTFYKFTNIPAKQFFVVNSELYFTTNGTIEKFSKANTDDNGSVIESRLELGFNDFGYPHIRKNTRKLWAVLEPAIRTSLNITWATDRKSEVDNKTLTTSFNLFSFSNIKFSNFSFNTNPNPQTIRKKARIKKYSFVKFILSNNELSETLTILSLRVQAQLAGQVK